MVWIKTFVKGVFMTVPTWIACTDIFYTIRSVDGLSMQPTLNTEGDNTDFVVLSRWAAAGYHFERGEIVSLVSPKNPSEWLIKRVVALEGDQIKTAGCFEETVDIPRGHVWVEGDNRLCSMDSNNFGAIPTGLITAKAIRVVWPRERMGVLKKEEFAGDRVTERQDVTRGKVFFGWDAVTK